MIGIRFSLTGPTAAQTGCTSSGGRFQKGRPLSDGYVWGPIYEQRWCNEAICKAVPASANVAKRYCHQ